MGRIAHLKNSSPNCTKLFTLKLFIQNWLPSIRGQNTRSRKKILVSTTWNLKLQSHWTDRRHYDSKKRCIRAKTFVTDSWKSLWCSNCTLHRFFLIKFIQMVIYSFKILSLTGWLLPENWPRHFKVEMPQACRSLSILAFEF